MFQSMKIKTHMLFEFVKSPFIGSVLSVLLFLDLPVKVPS